MYYVYLLKDPASERIYIGYTFNLRRRLKEHREGKTYTTRRFTSTELIYYELYKCKPANEGCPFHRNKVMVGDDTSHQEESIPGKNAEGRFDPKDIANPVSAYFFLSDDAHDTISGGDKKRMKCRSCGHRFAGQTYDSCPECFSLETEGATDEKDDEYW